MQFDKNGNTGGCQDTYTMIAAQGDATCQNLTAPLTPLDVEGTVFNGPTSRYGWINQVEFPSHILNCAY